MDKDQLKEFINKVQKLCKSENVIIGWSDEGMVFGNFNGDPYGSIPRPVVIVSAISPKGILE